jgi:amino acid permease
MHSETSSLLGSPLATQGDVATFFNLSKLIMGAGGFAFPWSFSRMGLVTGLLSVFGVVGLGSITMSDLKDLKTHVEMRSGRENITYADVAREALGSFGAAFVYSMTVFTIIFACAAYLAYIAETLNAIWSVFDPRVVVMLTGLFILPITWLDDFSWLSRLAFMGTIAVVLGYTVTISYAVLYMTPESQSLTRPVHSTSRGFGPIAFLLCIHYAVFPIITASRASRRVGGFECIATGALITAGIINGTFGSLGYVYFGTSVSPIVLNDIAGDSWFFVATKLLMCVDLVSTYPLVFVVARQLIESTLGLSAVEDTGKGSVGFPSQGDEEAMKPLKWASAKTGRLVVRACLVLLSVVVGIVGDFGGIVSLVGGFGLGTMAFVMPPLMALKVLPEMSPFRRCLNIVLIPVGVTVCAMSTFATIDHMLGLST